MRLTKKHLRKIIKEEYQNVLKEYGHAGPNAAGREMPYHEEIQVARKRNAAPPLTSNWRAFANAMDIGVLDLDEVAYEMGMRNFDQLDAAISPRNMSDEEADKLVSIMFGINGAEETAVFDAMDLPYGE